MKNEQYKDFEAIMSRAALLTFQQRGKDWRALVTAMFEELAAYDLEAVRAAVAGHVRAEKFFPTLADIAARIDGSSEDRAALAWTTVVHAVERIGRVHSVRFSSPAIHYAIEHMGGWQSLCSTLTGVEIKWRGKDFARFFEMGERLASWEDEPGKARVSPYLVGVYEALNRRGGYELPNVINAETGAPIAGGRMALPAPLPSAPCVISSLAEGMKAEEGFAE
jgi:hypothetical protein